MIKLSLGRRKQRPTPIDQLLQALVIARIAYRVSRTYQRARPALRFARRAAVIAGVVLLIRRLARRGHASPSVPYVPPSPQPSDNGLHTETATERNLEAEKDSG